MSAVKIGEDPSKGVPMVKTNVLAVFAILFGTRKIDVTEHHEGMMLAIALDKSSHFLFRHGLGNVPKWKTCLPHTAIAVYI